MGNPAIFPLIYGSQTSDVVIVHINPLNREEVPRTAKDILNRINEISFNSSLMREMRAIAFVTHLIDDGQLNDDKHRDVDPFDPGRGVHGKPGRHQQKKGLPCHDA